MKTAVRSVGAFAAGLWGALPVLVQILLILQLIDILSGLLAAWCQRTVSSDVSFRGMAKKVLCLALIGGAHALELGFAFDIPLSSIAAGFYCIHEIISITENAARTGLPVPQQLLDVLQKLQDANPPAAPPAQEQGQPRARVAGGVPTRYVS